MDRETNPQLIKKQQQRNILIIAVITFVVLMGVRYAIANHNPPVPKPDAVKTVSFATPLDQVNPDAIWIERAQNDLAQQTKNTNALGQQLQLLKQNQNKTLQQQAQEIQNLTAEVKVLQSAPQKAGAVLNGSGATNNLFPNPTGQGSGNAFLQDTALQLSPRHLAPATSLPLKNPNTYVPAGTFARAVVIEGADASAGVTSQANPTPMLFHIIDNGTLPNHRKSHLKDCFATSAVVGDISSERGQVRLEQLSCTKPDGDIIDIPVEATVAGPDGKDGIRGMPLWREQALLERAFIAGTLSGISSGIAQSYTSNSVSPWGAVQTVDNGKILQYGLANGVGNAAEKLADYNIQRADQYHPVIQLSAGTVVDVVFLKGFYFDGKNGVTDEGQNTWLKNSVSGVTINTNSLSNTNTTTYTQPGFTTATPTTNLPLTPQEIQILQQKNAQQAYMQTNTVR